MTLYVYLMPTHTCLYVCMYIYIYSYVWICIYTHLALSEVFNISTASGFHVRGTKPPNKMQGSCHTSPVVATCRRSWKPKGPSTIVWYIHRPPNNHLVVPLRPKEMIYPCHIPAWTTFRGMAEVACSFPHVCLCQQIKPCVGVLC